MRVLIGWLLTCLGWCYLGAEILGFLYVGQPMLIGVIDTIDMSLPLLSGGIDQTRLAHDFALAPEGTLRQALHYANALPLAIPLLLLGWTLRLKVKPARKTFSMRRAS